MSNFACMKKQGAGCIWDWPYPLTRISSEIRDAMREIFQRKSIPSDQIHLDIKQAVFLFII